MLTLKKKKKQLDLRFKPPRGSCAHWELVPMYIHAGLSELYYQIDSPIHPSSFVITQINRVLNDRGGGGMTGSAHRAATSFSGERMVIAAQEKGLSIKNAS